MTLSSAGLINHECNIIGQSVRLNLHNNQLINQYGVIAATEQLSTTSGMLNNDSGLMQSGADMHIQTGHHLLSNQNSRESDGIISHGKLTLETGDVNNRRGIMTGNDDLQLISAKVDNSDGIIATQKTLKLTASQQDNHINQTPSLLNDRIRQATRMASSAQGGMISAKNHLILHADNLFNQQGVLVSGASAQLEVGRMENQAAQKKPLRCREMHSITIMAA